MKYLSLFFYIFSFSLISCSSSLINITGHFGKKKDGFIYSLILKEDSSFKLTINGFEVDCYCTGKWSRHGKSVLLQQSDTDDIAYYLSSGYLQLDNDSILNVISKNKIKYRDIILRRY